ncbi:MAG: GGDEF domain-containing protein [Candidatus Omnitrophica bacterium]|nr:GGDEF domain-containing protein [Candidatus Omnitrophota bacterium]
MNSNPFNGSDQKLPWIVGGFLFVTALGIFDVFTGPHFSFELLYLVPVTLVIWFAGRWAGTYIALAGAVTWLTAAVLQKPPEISSFTHLWNTVSRLLFFAVVAVFIPHLRTAWQQEKELARTDFLTGVANKRCFMDMASLELERNTRYNRPFTFVYMDIDNFKFVNDRMGHNAGDTLLRAVAQTLKKKVRSIDLVARLGGDEFAVLLPETQSQAARIVVQRIQKDLIDLVEKNEWPVSFSFGVATFMRPPESVEEMIRKADALMYASKNNGKNLIKHELIGGPAPVEVPRGKPAQIRKTA